MTLLLQCTVRQLCEGELCNNSAVNHKALCLTAAHWWSLPPHSGGGCREGSGVTGPRIDTKDGGVEQAPAGRDYCNLCHWLNGFPGLRGYRPPDGAGPQWRANGWTHPGLLSDVVWWELLLWKTSVLAAPERYYLLCGSIRQGGRISKDGGWMGSVNRGLEKYWQSIRTSRERLLGAAFLQSH